MHHGIYLVCLTAIHCCQVDMFCFAFRLIRTHSHRILGLGQILESLCRIRSQWNPRNNQGRIFGYQDRVFIVFCNGREELFWKLVVFVA